MSSKWPLHRKRPREGGSWPPPSRRLPVLRGIVRGEIGRDVPPNPSLWRDIAGHEEGPPRRTRGGAWVSVGKSATINWLSLPTPATSAQERHELSYPSTIVVVDWPDLDCLWIRSRRRDFATTLGGVVGELFTHRRILAYPGALPTQDGPRRARPGARGDRR